MNSRKELTCDVPFAFQSDNYWSSTDVPGNPSNAYNVNMNNGNVNNDDKTNPNNLVRCVR